MREQTANANPQRSQHLEEEERVQMSLSSCTMGVRASATTKERGRRSSPSHARDVTLAKVSPDILSREVMAESGEAPSPHPHLHPRPHPHPLRETLSLENYSRRDDDCAAPRHGFPPALNVRSDAALSRSADDVRVTVARPSTPDNVFSFVRS